MSTTLAPQMRDPDYAEGCGGQTSGTRNMLTWGIHSHGPLVFVILGGELHIATAPGLARRLAPLAETGSHLLLDLAGLQFCDCAGLSVFLRLRRRVIPAGGSLHLTAPTAAMRRLIVVTRLHDLLPVAAGPAEVITMLSRDDAIAPPRPPPDDIDIKHTQGRCRPGRGRGLVTDLILARPPDAQAAGSVRSHCPLLRQQCDRRPAWQRSVTAR